MRHRYHLSASERQLRSKLTKLIRSGGLMRASMVTLRNTCGKANCKCQRGEKHESLYLAQSRMGKQHMQYVPRSWHSYIKAWVARYQEVQQILESLSEIYWQKLKKREK